jgi:predicted  nucleic acid-binding Zn-ribbon protein
LRAAEEKLAENNTSSNASIKKLKEDLEIARKEVQHRERKWREAATQERKAKEELSALRRKLDDMSLKGMTLEVSHVG